MRIKSIFTAGAIFLAAGAVSYFGATRAANFIETRTVEDLSHALNAEGYDWVTVHANGLMVFLEGTAQDEAARFKALTVANGIIDAARVVDDMNVVDAAGIAPPTFAVEILRNGDGVSLIGLVPTSTNRDAVVESITKLADGAQVTDMLDSADHPKPKGWDAAMQFGLTALRMLPESKISISSNMVSVTAISGSPDEKRALEKKLRRAQPKQVKLELNISSPRPVITPFTLRYVVDENGSRFDACSADTEKAKAAIIAAAMKAGVAERIDCTIGLGVPTPSWQDAVITGIKTLENMGGGTITFSDADVTLVALDTIKRSDFERAVSELEAELPELFSLHSVLPKPVAINGTGVSSGPPEFIATLSPEGQVQLRGRVTDERLRAAAESFAKAEFGVNKIYSATLLDEKLPDGWPIRILAGIEALSELENGAVVVQENFVQVRGKTGNPDARANIARLLSDKLGESENYGIEVTYEKKLDPIAQLPTPEECILGINAILAEQKISFAPGSADIDSNGLKTITKIADILRKCPEFKMEIAGHTDSQGREEMNQALSQSRAQSVLNALMARRVLASKITAKGYGEINPIADNKTEEGRESNRRIEFTLIEPKTTPEQETALEQLEKPASDISPTTTEPTDEQN